MEHRSLRAAASLAVPPRLPTALLDDAAAGLELPEEAVRGAIERARARALAFLDAVPEPGLAVRAAVLAFAADAAAELQGGPLLDRLLPTLVANAARVTGLPEPEVRLEIGTRALASPLVVGRESKAAVGVVLELLRSLAPAERASVWVRTPRGVSCSAHADHARPTRRDRDAARALLLGGRTPPPGDRGRIRAVTVPTIGLTRAALVLRLHPSASDLALALAVGAADVVAAILEREAAAARDLEAERLRAQTAARRLLRLGFDLHDGPIQDVAALAGDLRLFRDQLRSVTAGLQHAPLLAGRIDDLEARLAAVDRELRDLAGSLGPSSLLQQPLAEILGRLAADLEERTDIDCSLELQGDFEDLSESQRIAIVRVVQEALANARAHSGARSVRIVARTGDGGAEVEIADDGTGFDVEAALIRAAGRRSLGLVGIRERVRLLGGSLTIDSRPGGPTAIRARLPRWRASELPAAAGRSGAGRPRDDGEPELAVAHGR
jgi:signal transduction histidine kinase